MPSSTARTVVYYVLGFTVDEQSRLQWDAAGADLPDSQSVLADDANARFRFGVDLLVNGIGVTQLVGTSRLTTSDRRPT